MFAPLSRRTAIGLAVVAAMAAMTIPSGALANEDPEYGPPPQSKPITDPSVRAITADALAAFKYVFAAVLSDPAYTAYPRESLEAGVLAGFATLPREGQAHYAGVAQRLVQASPAERERHFGRHGRRSVEEVRRLGFDGLFTNVWYDRQGLTKYVRSVAARNEAQARQDEALAMQRAIDYRLDPQSLQLMTLKKLNLRIDMVKCVDETDWWFGTEPGEDEIRLGGVKIDHKGVTTQVGQWKVGDFEDGDVVTYLVPGKLFSSFDLTQPGAWGRTYTNVVMMAEEDFGGFADMLTTAWQKIMEKVNAEIVEAVQEAASSVGIPEAIAQALAEATAWLVNEFVNSIISIFEDDLFPPVTYEITLPSKWAWLYNNPADLGWTNKKLPPVTVTYTGHGGKYKVNMHYEVVS